MAYKDNTSPHPDRWTNVKLIAELRRTANLRDFGGINVDGDQIREATRIYRNAWMNPLIDEIEKRFVKGRRA